jgi:hypothetical protein
LRAEPNVCLERVHKRDRAEESSVSLDYLTAIHEKHDEWLSQCDSYNGIPIYVIDNTEEPSKALEQVCRITNYDSKYYQVRNYILYQSFRCYQIALNKLFHLKNDVISKIRTQINL